MGEVRSALNKAIRRGQEDQALYWSTEIVRSGFEAYLWSTLFVIMSEDIGLAEPALPATMWGLYDMWELQRKKKNPNRPERLFWAQAVLLCVRARKSRIVDDALCAHWGTDERLYEVPDEALDPHTQATSEETADPYEGTPRGGGDWSGRGARRAARSEPGN